jgi:electron transfer flavoprotein alpha subunit
VADAAHYGDQTAENLAALIVAAVANPASGYSHIIAPATSNGKNTLPRVAALLDVAQISEIICGGRRRHLRPPDLRRQCPGDGQVQ